VKRGPPRAELGVASCPTCGHDGLKVATNKHGYPAAYCRECETQFQPRSETGSLMLIGRIHRWTNQPAAELMLADEDRAALARVKATPAPQLPQHLARPSSSPAPRPSSKPKPSSAPETTPTPPTPAPATPPKKPWYDREL
jgi:hypothetical protein